jgi:hypothetical protein
LRRAAKRDGVRQSGAAIRLPRTPERKPPSVLEINECAAFPKLLMKLFSRDSLTRFSEQSRQDLQRLPLQSHTHAIFGQLARASIERIGTETS